MGKNRSFPLVSVFVLMAILVSPLAVSFARTPGESAAPVASAGLESPNRAPDTLATVTLLHTNDFHGNLELSGSNPGMARTAAVINGVRTAVGADNVALFDAGDFMQGTLLSNLFQGESTMDVYNLVGYDAATFGNHEFDWGKTVLADRVDQAEFPFVSSNIVVNDTGNCATAGWTPPAFASPWMTMTVGSAGNQVVIGLVGVTSQETPYITIASATEGLCFKDPAQSISHHYADVMAAGADVLVVLSHIGFNDGGLGYGFSFYGDKTMAQRLITAGTPADLIIGGHSHTDLAAPTLVGNTLVVQAHYAGRKVGRADVAVNRYTGAATINWQRLTVSTSGPEDPDVKARITLWASDPWYQSEINRVVGFTNVDLTRFYDGDGLMGKFVNDSIYFDLNNDAEPLNDVDMVFNNPGGLRADILTGGVAPFTLTHGLLYSVLPFGNATIVGNMTGAQIQDLLNQSATLFKGALQVAGIRHSFYRYSDALPGPQPWAWGAFDITVYDPDTLDWEPLVMTQTYRVATNEFLAPAGQDGFTPFKYMTNISYWGDMLDGVERWVAATYTIGTPYNGVLDGRITRDGDNAGGSIIPVTILHHNDSHGNLAKGAYVGYTQLATLIAQERAHNPDRSLLLNAGDQIQGDSMMYYYRTAPLGYAADGTILTETLTTHPMMAAMNAMTYTAMTLGNHEFNFGNQVFTNVLSQANFPVLQANLLDDGRYGLDDVGVLPYVEVTVPGEVMGEDIQIAVLGIGNHRVPNYELPSNIVGLTFTNPLTEAETRGPALAATNDAVIALTHIGFTENPASVEVDDKVDTNLAQRAGGIDAVIGSHSHTNPATGFGAYKYLPAIIGGPDNTPVIVNQAYRYNNTLGQVILGMRTSVGGGYEVVARAGRYQTVASDTAEDARIKAIVDPYVVKLNAYNNTVLGQTTAPIDALTAFIQETNAANLQADASVAELAANGINVDFHISGAMTNRKVADGATPASPVELKVADMFTLMPYENSLVTMQMNGPQLKQVLERGYRNYYYYKYVSGYGGYSYYTTCMLDINDVGQITYRDSHPQLPNGQNVASLVINGVPVDFNDASTYYLVSTVNYLAAGSCNFNDGGVSLWPLDQIVHDTQFYVRDAVIHYIQDQEIISPAIEGRLIFQSTTFWYSYLPIISK